MRRGLGRGIVWGTVISVPLWIAACSLLPPASPGYVVCNETGNDAGCGDNVIINVE